MPFTGRESYRQTLIESLQIQPQQMQMPLVIYGMAGIGKSALAASVIEDSHIREYFAGGIFWLSLGQHPVMPALSPHLKQVLFVLDDVWDVEHIRHFTVSGYDNRLLITTRLYGVAQLLAVRQSDIYKLPLLTPTEVGLTGKDEIEGLPLLLQVLSDFGDPYPEFDQILESRVPSNYIIPINEFLPTVASLFKRQVDVLPTNLLHHLKTLSRKPAKWPVFDLQTLQVIWQTHDVKPVIRELVNYGLLDPLGNGTFYLSTLMRAFINLYL